MSVNAPSTFLELAQRLRQECGGTGTGPATVVGQVGEYARLVSWIVSAWIDIQSKHEDWGFLRASCAVATVAGQSEYTPLQCGIPAGTFGTWDRQTFRNYVTAAGVTSEVHMDGGVDYDAWRNTYLFGAARAVRTRPSVASERPSDHALALGPVPAAGYTVTGDYYTAPVILANNADEPAIPVQDRIIIVWRALMDYGGYAAASEAYQRAKQEHDVILARLEARWLAPIRCGPALV